MRLYKWARSSIERRAVAFHSQNSGPWVEAARVHKDEMKTTRLCSQLKMLSRFNLWLKILIKAGRPSTRIYIRK